MSKMLEEELGKSLSSLKKESWNNLAEDESPFLEWDFLNALEESACVAPEKGWAAVPLLLKRGGDLVAAAPLYLKGHSLGEFVFDHSWANLAQRMGEPYYPKGIIAVPFSPVPGARMLIAPEENQARVRCHLGRFAQKVAAQMGLSGIHWLFLEESEAQSLAQVGYALRLGIQYHWRNPGYRDFDDWLSTFKGKRRRMLRRERREVLKEVEVRVLEGDALTSEVMALAFRLYLTTIDKKSWGRQYLNESFFKMIGTHWRSRLMLILAYRGEEVIAGSFFIHKAGRLYGRYWGCFEEVRFLHFELSYYRPIQLCIERKWTGFEAGAQGEHKYDRGFAPTLTYSAHHLRSPLLSGIIETHLQQEVALIRREHEAMIAASPCRLVQLGEA